MYSLDHKFTISFADFIAYKFALRFGRLEFLICLVLAVVLGGLTLETILDSPLSLF
jgi:hypothetical protein